MANRGNAGSSLDGESEVGSEEESGNDRRERRSLDKIKGLGLAIFSDLGKPRGCSRKTIVINSINVSPSKSFSSSPASRPLFKGGKVHEICPGYPRGFL